MPAPINHNGRVATLSRQTCAASTRKNRRSKCPAYSDCRLYVVNRSRHDHTDRHLPVIRSIHGVQSARTCFKTHRPCHLPFQFCFESGIFHLNGPPLNVGTKCTPRRRYLRATLALPLITKSL